MNLAAATECEGKLQSSVILRMRYFDYERLISADQDQLKALQAGAQTLKTSLQAKFKRNQEQRVSARNSLPAEHFRATYQEQMAMEAAAGLHTLQVESEQLEEDLRSVQHFGAAVARALANHKPVEAPRSVLVLDLKIGAKTDTQVMAEITSMVGHLRGGRDAQLLRFFPNANEDLVRAHGTDLYGREFGSQDAWDEFGLEGTLRERGLKAEDGLYAVPHEIAHDFGRRQNGEPIPFSMVQDFMRGTRALAIYDFGQFEDFSTDFFVFKEPAQKRKALLAIIRPRQK